MDDLPTAVAVSDNLIHKIGPSLAMQLVAGLAPMEEVLKRFSITREQFKLIARTPRFKQVYTEAKAQWESDANARDRIRAKATSLVEELMLDMFAIASDEAVTPANRLDSFRTLAKMGGVEGVARKDGEVDAGPGFVVTINLTNPESQEKEVITIDGNSDSSAS